jgi:glycosyltransferase involved in cell wall biosynthesis
MNPVSILVSNYNSGDAIQLLVESIRRYTPEGAYKLIVYNDICKNGIDDKYLQGCRDRGWLTLFENTGEKALGYQTIVNRLLHDICDTEKAVLMDCDIQIKAHGWLEDMARLLEEPSVLAACDYRDDAICGRGWCSGFYRFWFGGLNMTAYRDGMHVDWGFSEGDRREWPYCEMFKKIEHVGFPEKYVPGFDDNKVFNDPGSQLWLKTHFYNPKKYRVLDIPQYLTNKFHHYGHVSFFYDIPDDYDDYTKRTKAANRSLIGTELARLRCA